MVGEGGDVVFGPVPVAAHARTPFGVFQFKKSSRSNDIILFEGEGILAVQGQPADYGDDLGETSGGVRLSNRHMNVLFDLVEVYDESSCVVAEGAALPQNVQKRDDLEFDRAEKY